MNEAEGWGLLSEHEAAIWHYYREGRALCRPYVNKTWIGELTQDEGEIVCCSDCKKCLLRLRRKFVKQNITSHEMRILETWASGLAKDDRLTSIGELLNFHPNTIKYHRDRLYDKLGATTPANAVYIAMKRGLLE